MALSESEHLIPLQVQRELLSMAGVDSEQTLPRDAQINIIALLEVMRKVARCPENVKQALIRTYIDAGRKNEAIDVDGIGRINISGVSAAILALPQDSLLFQQSFSTLGPNDENKIGLTAKEFLKSIEEDTNEEYVDNLTAERLEDPVIFLVRSVKKNCVLIDGKHRLKARFKRGFSDFKYYRIDERTVQGWLLPSPTDNRELDFDTRTKIKHQLEMMLILETLAVTKTVPYGKRLVAI